MLFIILIVLGFIVIWKRSQRPRTVSEEKVEAVRQMFPNFRAEDIRSDLLITNSVQMTIENIIQGKLIPSVPVESTPSTSRRIPQQDAAKMSGKHLEEVTNLELLLRKQSMLEECRLGYLAKMASKPKTE